MKRFSGNRRHAALALLLALIILIPAAAFAAYIFRYSGTTATPPAADLSASDVTYQMEITPYYAEGALAVTQTTTFANSGAPLDRLVFALPANAYRRAQTAPMTDEAFAAAFPDAYTPGGIEFASITVDGRAVEWGVSGAQEALLTLLCDVPAGRTVSVRMEYHVLLPEFSGAGGISGAEWSLSGFCPQLARLEGAEWRAYAPARLGQYVSAPAADYDITLHAQSGYTPVASGSAVLEGAAEGWSTWRIRAFDTREPVIVLRHGGSAYERDVNGVKVRAYAPDRLAARRMLDAAAALTGRMSELYPYPYPALSVVMGDYGGRSLSAGGVIMLDARAADPEAQLAYLIARQWWGGIVGSDPFEEPWLSEALAQYSALVCARDAAPGAYRAMRAAIDSALRITLPGGLTVESEQSAFSAQTDYDSVLRYRGAAVLELLDEAMEGGLNDALRGFAGAHAFGFAGRQDFINAINAAGGGDWSAWLAETLQGVGRAG